MEIKDSYTLACAIKEIAPFCVGWALTEEAGDIRRMAEARFRRLMYKELGISLNLPASKSIKRRPGCRRKAPDKRLPDLSSERR